MYIKRPDKKSFQPDVSCKSNLCYEKYENFCAALQARNNVAHTYNRLVALDIVEQTKSRFYDMFVTLKDEMEANWI